MLETGGHYVGTIPDAYWIVKKLRSIEGLEFGNDVYKIRFEQKDDYPMYGHKYWFNLEDAISDCPEYLVYFPELERLAREYKLKLVKKQKFHEFVQKYYYEEMLQRMRVFGDDNKQKVPEDQWEAIGIYMVFSFIKE
jgi:mRNA (guanine-N7-)-methyltransferase